MLEGENENASARPQRTKLQMLTRPALLALDEVCTDKSEVLDLVQAGGIRRRDLVCKVIGESSRL